MKKILIVLIISLECIFLHVVSKYYKADVLYIKSKGYLNDLKVGEALSLINKSIELNPHEPNYLKERSKIKIVSLIYNKYDYEERKTGALFDMQKSIELNPNNLVTARNLIPLYYFLSYKELYSNSSDNLDGKYMNIAREYYRYIKERYRNDAGVVLSVARYEKKLGLNNDFNESMEMIKKLRPDLLEWHEVFK